jgi:hypothetical protein
MEINKSSHNEPQLFALILQIITNILDSVRVQSVLLWTILSFLSAIFLISVKYYSNKITISSTLLEPSNKENEETRLQNNPKDANQHSCFNQRHTQPCMYPGSQRRPFVPRPRIRRYLPSYRPTLTRNSYRGAPSPYMTLCQECKVRSVCFHTVRTLFPPVHDPFFRCKRCCHAYCFHSSLAPLATGSQIRPENRPFPHVNIIPPGCNAPTRSNDSSFSTRDQRVVHPNSADPLFN